MALLQSQGNDSLGVRVDSAEKLTPRGGRSKKRSLVSKLVDKRRQTHTSDADSDFGSSSSLQNKFEDQSKLQGPQKNAIEEEAPLSAGTKDSAFSDDSFDKFLKSKTVKDNGEYISALASSDCVERRPIPVPRKSTIVQNEIHSDIPMDIDEDSNDIKNTEKDDLKKNAPSDATLHRFRSLKMANEKSDTVDSLKNSPFKPKPPTIPKSPSKKSPVKGEKRTRDPYSSSEEPEYDLKNQVSRHKGTKLDSDSAFKFTQKTESRDVDGVGTNETGSHAASNVTVAQIHRETKTKSKDSRSNDISHDNVASSGKNLDDKNQKKRITRAEKIKSKKPLRNYDESQPSNFMYNTTDGNFESRRGQKLSPLSPRKQPPPFPYSVSSRSLKTSYKSDPAYLPDKEFSQTIAGKSPDSVSQTSAFTITNGVMKSIPTRHARSKDSCSNIVREEEELQKFFPDHKVHVWVGSWNMGEIKETKECLDDFLLPEESSYMQEIYAVGTQENNLTKKEWEVVLQATLGRSHVLFHSVTHGSLHLAIFIRRDLIWYCSIPEEDQVTLRAVTMVKTKGAVAISFMLFGTSFLFVNCHFTSDDEKKKDRIGDFQKIIKDLKIPKFLGGSGSGSKEDGTSKYDCVFWCGDLNFRIDKGRTCVEDLVSYITSQDFPNFEDLLRGDQLTKCLIEGTIFGGFQEGRINFKPTYKFDVNTDTYDTSHKNRIPSYTDRILFRAKRKNSVVCTHYDSVMSIKTSDHRPVLALFEALLKAGGENVPTAGGQFDRSVYMAASKRQVQHKATEQKNQKSSSVCSVQ
ncbi:hypothetical protein ScPMuIL_009855 [Solemya velum]